MRPELNNLIGPEPPTEWKCDGCTWSPDRWGSVDLRPACRRHDWYYKFGGTLKKRREADRFFLVNLILLDCPILIACAYWLAVRSFGWYRWLFPRKPIKWR